MQQCKFLKNIKQMNAKNIIKLVLIENYVYKSVCN